MQKIVKLSGHKVALIVYGVGAKVKPKVGEKEFEKVGYIYKVTILDSYYQPAALVLEERDIQDLQKEIQEIYSIKEAHPIKEYEW